MVRDIHTGLKALFQQFLHHRALHRPHQVAGDDAAGRADALAQRRHIHQRVAVIGAVVQTVGACLKQALAAGVLAGKMPRIFHRCDSHGRAAHFIRLQRQIHGKILVTGNGADHNNVVRQHVSTAQHVIGKAGNGVVAHDAPRRRGPVPHRVLYLAGDADGLYRHHAACSAHALKHQHMAGVHNMHHAPPRARRSAISAEASSTASRWVCSTFFRTPLHCTEIFIHQHVLHPSFLSSDFPRRRVP